MPAGYLCFQMVSDADLTHKEFWKAHDNMLDCMGLRNPGQCVSKGTEICCTLERDFEGCAEEPEPSVTA